MLSYEFLIILPTILGYYKTDSAVSLKVIDNIPIL